MTSDSNESDNNQPQHQQQQQQHEIHFIDGIGDGKHHEYDLPDPNSHSFIRKKHGIEDLQNHHQKMKQEHNHNNNQYHNSVVDDKEGEERVGKIVEREEQQKTYDQQQQKQNIESSVGQIHSINSPPPLNIYQIHDSYRFFQSPANSSSSFFVILLSVIGVAITIQWFKIGKKDDKNKANIKSMLSSITTASFLYKVPFFQRRIQNKLRRMDKKKTDEWNEDHHDNNDDIEEDKMTSIPTMIGVEDQSNAHYSIDGFYGQYHKNARLRKNAHSMANTARSNEYDYSSENNIQQRKMYTVNDDVIEFGVGLDGFDSRHCDRGGVGDGVGQQQQQQQLQQYGDYMSDCNTTSVDDTSEEEWDQISTRSMSSHASSTKQSPHNPMQKNVLPISPIKHDDNTLIDSPCVSYDYCEDNTFNTSHHRNHPNKDQIAVHEDEEMPTPRIENIDHQKRLYLPSVTTYNVNHIPDLPSLDSNLTNDTISQAVKTPTAASNNVSPIQHEKESDPYFGKSPAPRSISVDELKLIRMETGIVEKGLPKWKSKMDLQDLKLDYEAKLSSPELCIMKGDNDRKGDNISNHKEDEMNFSGETEGANGILHKRKNLTSASDAASSLTSPIIFTELKMKEQIGGGGFGQVWKATWRGTPVAVKVLAVSHKAEHIQKAILEEFAAEINMVSGMRHPNICLYIGACLEPSNRAIVTELASNGSLWDALRIPLRPPNVVADGKTRNVWPLNLYETTPSNSTSNGAELSPPVPFGTSPYFPIAPQGAW